MLCNIFSIVLDNTNNNCDSLRQKKLKDISTSIKVRIMSHISTSSASENEMSPDIILLIIVVVQFYMCSAGLGGYTSK